MKKKSKLIVFALALLLCASCRVINPSSSSEVDSSLTLDVSTSLDSEMDSESNDSIIIPSISSSEDLESESTDSEEDQSSSTSPNIIYVKSIELDVTNKIMEIGETFSLNYNLLPENATNKSVIWTSSSSNVASVDENGNVLAKSSGSAIITASSDDGSKVSDKCTIRVNAPTKKDWELITNVSDLQAGDVIVLAYSDKGVTAGEMKTGSNAQYLGAKASTFSNDKQTITLLSEDTLAFTLGKSDHYWTLKNESGSLLGATSAKNLSWDSGTTTWNITIGSNGNATITNTNSNCGIIYYNISSPRFTTYTSIQALPQIYRGQTAEPIYPTSIEIVGKTDLAIGETYQYYVNFAPLDTNQKDVVWESDNTSVASVSKDGVVSGLKEGTATITVTTFDSDNNLIQNSITINVKMVSVTGVSLNSNSIEVSINGTSKLTANILPSNATNKNITWTSSNPSVATVEEGVVKGISVGSSVITAITEDGNFKATCNAEVKDVILDDYTIMIYMCGSDLESDEGLATENITEILSVKNMPDNVNIIIETGGAKKWKSTYGISANYLQRWHIENNKLIRDAQLSKASMGNSSTFQSFMEWGLTEYDANQIGVVFWNHGGAIDGCCYDENYNYDSLTNNEVHQALQKAFKTMGRTQKLSWVGYDACLMAVTDIADLNSDYFEYMVASQESEPGEGWDYDKWIDDLYADTKIEAPELLTEISDTFVEKCAECYNSYGGQYRGFNDATMSVLDLSKMINFRAAWENMASNLSNIITSSSKWSTFKTLVKKCQQFGYDSSYGYTYDVFDLKDFIDLIKANSTYSSIGINEVETAFNDVIVYNVYGSDSADASGLCFFCAVYGYTLKSTYTNSDTYFTNWRALNISYGIWSN